VSILIALFLQEAGKENFRINVKKKVAININIVNKHAACVYVSTCTMHSNHIALENEACNKSLISDKNGLRKYISLYVLVHIKLLILASICGDM